MKQAERLLLRRVTLGSRTVDVLIERGHVARIGHGLSAPARVIDGGGGLLMPGLHDHHIHLLATAAAAASLVCGPPNLKTRTELVSALAKAPGTGWIRGVDYHESVAGILDRSTLDSILESRPVRIQHRGGSLWMLNTAALDLLDLTHDYPDGRLWRADAVLRERVGSAPPDLTKLGMRLASYGVTGVTDATPGETTTLATAVASIAQHVVTMGAEGSGSMVEGALKIVVSDHALPGIDELTEMIAVAHGSNRPVAVHCVTRESLLLVLAALESVGSLRGDRIEHAAVVPPEVVDTIERLGLAVVTQPSLIARRGDSYVEDVAPDDVSCLWPYASLLGAGVRVASSSDAPYGDLDPWASIRAARDRLTPLGRMLGPYERIDVDTALGSYLSAAHDPGGPQRQVVAGSIADLALLDVDEKRILADPRKEHVRMTIIAGRVAFDRSERD